MIDPCERPECRGGEQTPPAAGSPARRERAAHARRAAAAGRHPPGLDPHRPGDLAVPAREVARAAAALVRRRLVRLRMGRSRRTRLDVAAVRVRSAPARAALAGGALPVARLAGRPGLPDRALDVPAKGRRLRRRPPVPPGPATAGALPARRAWGLGAAGPRAGDARPAAAEDRA